MPTLVLDPQPVELEALIERRRRLGQDLLDEVWDGVLHMNPAPSGRHADIAQQLAVLLDQPARRAGLVPMLSIFNLGEPGNYRVPDGGLHRQREDRVYYPTAALVAEIVSPDDETWKKLEFYAAHEVDELLIVDPQAADRAVVRPRRRAVRADRDQRRDRARARRARTANRLALTRTLAGARAEARTPLAGALTPDRDERFGLQREEVPWPDRRPDADAASGASSSLQTRRPRGDDSGPTDPHKEDHQCPNNVAPRPAAF